MGRLKDYVKKAGEMSIEEVIEKAARKSRDKLHYEFVKRSLKMRNMDMKDDPSEPFRPSMKFLFDTGKGNVCLRFLKRSGKAGEILAQADKVCNHVFNLLGSGDVYLGDSIDWRCDFKTGFIWENDFYRDIEIIDLDNRADVKVPWELSRFQHIAVLGRAYWVSEDEKYAAEFKREIEDWIQKNPYEMSVNWTCAMDVAIRACNWITGYYFFKDSKIIDNVFWNKYNRSLYLHGKHIIGNLENRQRYNGNHYISNLAGLVWLGLYFGGYGNGAGRGSYKKWLEFGIKELEREMSIQVNEDGTDYESSTSYHRLVTELFLLTAILCNKNSIEFSKIYIAKLEKMCEFIMDITKPSGKAPIIGDADDGRFIMFSDYGIPDKNDFRGILAVAGELFDRDDFRSHAAAGYEEDAIWTVGRHKSTPYEAAHKKAVSYRDGGYYIFKNRRMYCIIRCGELSCRGSGGHSHNDQLSFELNVDGEDFIVDPGSYVYTADYNMRNEFRSTRVHNTLCFCKMEQNDFEDMNLFAMKEETFARCIEFSNSRFLGSHQGYLNKCGIIHEREFDIHDERILVKDRVMAKEETDVDFSCNMTLAAGVKATLNKGNVDLVKNGRRILINIGDNIEMKIKKAKCSKSYGVVEDTESILITGKACGENTVSAFSIELK